MVANSRSHREIAEVFGTCRGPEAFMNLELAIGGINPFGELAPGGISPSHRSGHCPYTSGESFQHSGVSVDRNTRGN